jgi:hypothetical protein
LKDKKVIKTFIAYIKKEDMLIIADGAVIEKNNESYIEWGMKSNEVEKTEELKEIELYIIEQLNNK